MGTWTYTNFRDFLRLQFGQRTDIETPTDYYGIWVNTAYKRLVTRNRFWGLRQDFYFPQLEVSDATQSTTAGTAYVNVPSDALIIRGVWDSTNDRILDNISWQEYISYTGRTTTSSRSKPTEWVRQGTYIYLYPTPDATYSLTIYYRKVPASLSASAEVTLIGTEWDEAILLLARIIGLQWMNEMDKVTTLKTEFKEVVSEIMGIYSEEQRAMAVEMTPEVRR